MSTLATDNFNRADGGLGASWTTFAGVAPAISSNQCIASGTSKGLAYYNGVTWPANQWSQVIVNSSGGNDGGPKVRASGTDCYYVQQFGGTLEVQRYNNNAPVTIATVGGSLLSAGGTLYLEAVGNALVVKVNGTTVISTTDNTIASGNAGVYCDNNSILDDWAGGDFVQPATRTEFAGSFGRGGARRARYPLAPAPSWGRFMIPTLAERMRFAA